LTEFTEKHNYSIPLEVSEAASLGAQLEGLQAGLNAKQFEELFRLVAFLRKLERMTRLDLDLLTEKRSKESEDPDFRGIVAEHHGQSDNNGGKEVFVIRWKQSLSAILLVDPKPTVKEGSENLVWPVEIFELVEDGAISLSVATLRA